MQSKRTETSPRAVCGAARWEPVNLRALLVFGGLVLLGGLLLLAPQRVRGAERPNVIVLLTDDHRFDALGCMGNSVIQTPNLDKLARGGVVFEQSFCTTSICAVSRASLLTGQYARRHGIWDFTTSLASEAFANTFPAQLRQHGYRTGFVGKWGVGSELPRDQYDYFDGFADQGRYYAKPGDFQQQVHLTRQQGASALKFLEGCSDDQPFCLQLSFKAAHAQDGEEWQFPSDHELAELYADQSIPVVATATEEAFRNLPPFMQKSEARARWQKRFANAEMYQQTVKDYYRLITGVDLVVGQIVEQLRARDLDRNTVIVFTADNGFYLGDYGLAGKWFMHEPSIRVPLIIYDPRAPESQRGRREPRMALNIDLAPTILELAGIARPAAMQGRSLVPLLAGQSVPWRTDFLYEHLFEHPRIAKSEGVRSERWKFVRYRAPEGPHEELYDLQADPHERTNLAQKPRHHSTKLAMEQRLEQLRTQAAGEHSAAFVRAGVGGGDAAKLAYPDTRRAEQVDDYHGQQVADPYRWLEDVDSEETKQWVEAQNKVTFEYLSKIPERAAIEKRLTELWNYERFGLPTKKGGRYFFTRNDGLQNQSVLFVAEALDAEPRMLLDPNKLSDDGTVALADWVVSDNGKYLAFALASAGSDWREWRVLDVDTGEQREDLVQWSKFSSASWSKDNTGFYYSRYDEPQEGEKFTGTNYYQKLFYHRLGTPQAEDELVYERKDFKDWGFDGYVTEDGHYLIITVWRGTENKNQIFYKDLQKQDAPVVELIAGFDAEYAFLGNEGPTFFLSTDLEAPLRRIIAVNIEQPQQDAWKEVIPEARQVLRGAGIVGGHFVTSYLEDARTVVKLFSMGGNFVRSVDFPSLGTASGFSGESDDPETFYDFSNFTTPSTIYHYNVVTGESRVFRSPKLAFDPNDYETRQVFYDSKDGTRVPMFITGRKGFKPTGDSPTLLYAYGGFDISLTPNFNVMNLVWLEMGGLYAQPNLRGGGEYGREWHEAGMLAKKQNVFDDFIAAAEYLIKHKYTTSEKLAIRGGSNGGLLIGASMTQRPELFGAALPAVGVMDMLRYHKFTIGWAWVNEYGSSDDAEQFRNLIKYSPLHNLKPGTEYPATMVTTADHDDRVVPGHSFKFAAALQHAHEGDNPVLIRIETSAGHGAGTPTSKLIAAAADMLGFLSEELDMKLPERFTP